MLRPKRIRGSKRVALIMVIILLLLVIGYLVYTNFLSAKIKLIKPLKVEVDILVVPKLNPELVNDFLTKSPYINLKLHGKLPVTVDKVGRKNPFRVIPFSLLEL